MWFRRSIRIVESGGGESVTKTKQNKKQKQKRKPFGA